MRMGKLLNKLFVYGTLRAGHDAHETLKAAGAKMLGAGKVRGTLHFPGDYPGLVRDGGPDSFVRGEVYELRNPEADLRILDEYEEFDASDFPRSLFVRKRSSVYMSDGSRVSAWVYFYNRPVVHAHASVATRRR